MEQHDSFGILWFGSSLILVAASPQSGRTAFAIQACFSAAEEGLSPAVYFSTSSGNIWQLRKLLFIHQMANSKWADSSSTFRTLPDIPVYLEEYDNPYVETLVQRIIFYAKEKKARLFVIDNLQLVDCSMLSPNRDVEDEYDNALRLLKSLVSTLSITILVTTRLSRHCEESAPTVRDILDITEAEEHCDQILLMHSRLSDSLDPGSSLNRVTKFILAQGYPELHNCEEITEVQARWNVENVSFTRIGPFPDE